MPGRLRTLPAALLLCAAAALPPAATAMFKDTQDPFSRNAAPAPAAPSQSLPASRSYSPAAPDARSYTPDPKRIEEIRRANAQPLSRSAPPNALPIRPANADSAKAPTRLLPPSDRPAPVPAAAPVSRTAPPPSEGGRVYTPDPKRIEEIRRANAGPVRRVAPAPAPHAE